jgi:hypothetical protein
MPHTCNTRIAHRLDDLLVNHMFLLRRKPTQLVPFVSAARAAGFPCSYILGLSVPTWYVRSALPAPHNGNADMAQTLRRIAEILALESGRKNCSIRISVATVLIVHREGVCETNGLYTDPLVFMTSHRNVPALDPTYLRGCLVHCIGHLPKGFA